MFSMFDDGYSLIVPKKYRWHHSHKGAPNFLQKLNLANLNTIMNSFERLREPEEGYKDPAAADAKSSPSDRLLGTPDEYSQKSEDPEAEDWKADQEATGKVVSA